MFVLQRQQDVPVDVSCCRRMSSTHRPHSCSIVISQGTVVPCI